MKPAAEIIAEVQLLTVMAGGSGWVSYDSRTGISDAGGSGPASALKLAVGYVGASNILEALAEAGYVIVPREPTEEMIKAAWANALGEDARGVWKDMIEVATALGQSTSGNANG